MKCKDIQENLSAYLDKELSEIENKLIEKHLKECLECSRSITSLKKAVNILHSLPTVNPSEKFSENLFNKINTQPTKILFFPKNLNKKILSFIVVAACFLFVVKIIFLQTGNLQVSEVGKIKQKRLAFKSKKAINNFKKKQTSIPLKKDTDNKQEKDQVVEKKLNLSSPANSNNKKLLEKVSPSIKNQGFATKNIETKKSNSPVNNQATDIALANNKKQNISEKKESGSRELNKNAVGESKSIDLTSNTNDGSKAGSITNVKPKTTPEETITKSKKAVTSAADYPQAEIVKVNFYVADIKTAKQILKKLNFKKTNKNTYQKEIFDENINNDLENLKKEGRVEIINAGYKTKQTKEMPTTIATDDSSYKKSKSEENLKGLTGGVGTTSKSNAPTSGTSEITTKIQTTTNKKNKKIFLKIYLRKK